MANFHHTGRFYESEFPAVDDMVVVQIQRLDDKSGVYVSLLEYDNKEGMINLGEISKRRIRSLAKLVRVGSQEICMVVSVDEDKGYINLSKKRVAQEDCPPKQEEYARAKAIHGVMQHVATSNNIPVEELCSKASWPLFEPNRSAYDVYKDHINGETNVWDQVDFSQPGMDLSDKADKLKKDIETVLQRRLMATVVRLQAKCEVACNEYEGIDAVKDALREGFKASKEECEIHIKLIAHPVFALSCMCRDKELGISVLDEAMEHIEKKIIATGGTFAVKSKPTLFVKEDPKEGEGDDSSSGSSSDSEGPQDETMGNLDGVDMSTVMNKKLDDDGED